MVARPPDRPVEGDQRPDPLALDDERRQHRRAQRAGRIGGDQPRHDVHAVVAGALEQPREQIARAAPARAPRRRSPAPPGCRPARSPPRRSARAGAAPRARRCARLSPRRRCGSVEVAACRADCIAASGIPVVRGRAHGSPHHQRDCGNPDAQHDAQRQIHGEPSRLPTLVTVVTALVRARHVGRRCRACVAPDGRDDGAMSATTTFSSYEQARAQHRWDVPERYNIAADVCDRHPARQARDDPRGLPRHRPATSAGASCRTTPTGSPTCSRAHGVERGRPGRDAAAADARDRGGVLRDVEGRRDPAVDVGALRRRGHPPPGRATPQPKVLRHQRGERGPHRALAGRARADPRRRAARARLDRRSTPSTPPPTTRPSSTTRRARPGWPRASSTPTATSSPTRSSSTATTCATASCSTAWASGRGRPGSARCSARGGSARSRPSTSARAASIPHKQLDFLSRHEVTQRVRRRRPRSAR